MSWVIPVFGACVAVFAIHLIVKTEGGWRGIWHTLNRLIEGK